MKTTKEASLKGLSHGTFVTMTGDPTRLRSLKKEVENSDYIAEAWKGVGAALQTSMKELPTPTRISQRSSRIRRK